MRVRKAKSPEGDARTSPGPKVEVVLTDATPLLDVLPSSKLWTDPASLPDTLAAMSGAIVRAQPPDGATEAQVSALRAAAKEAGARYVRVLPRKRARKAVPASTPAAPRGHRDLRGAVMRTFEASSFPYKEEMKAEIEKALGAAGL